MQSISENDFECFASTRVDTPINAMFEHMKRIDWERRGEQLPCKIREVIKSTFHHGSDV